MFKNSLELVKNMMQIILSFLCASTGSVYFKFGFDFFERFEFLFF